MIKSQIVADSISERGARLTTMLLTYPRFVHAEHMRHRMFSFCVASSRAIPTARFRELVETTPASPVWWGKNQSGMQAKEELTGEALESVKHLWQEYRREAIRWHTRLEDHGLHKQIANRILEAWMPVTVLTTGTDWLNFFSLRCHPDAQPEMQAAADSALYAYVHSEPVPVPDHTWHLPFITPQDHTEIGDIGTLKYVSVARCARTSYAVFSRKDIMEDVALAKRLATAGHWSPFEHVATPIIRWEQGDTGYRGNFRGWLQFRKTFREENRETLGTIDLKELLAQRIAQGSKYACASTPIHQPHHA